MPIAPYQDPQEDPNLLRAKAILMPQEEDPTAMAPGAPPPGLYDGPSASVPFDTRAHALGDQASTLEKQAAPPAPEHGMAILGKVLQAALEGFAGGYSKGPGYFEHQQARDAAEHTRQQDLLGRAKELRGEGAQQTQLGMQAETQRRAGIHDQSELELQQENARRAQHAQDFTEEVANRPKAGEMTPGSTATVTHPKTGETTLGPTAPARPSTEQLQTKVLDEGNGKMGLWAFDMSNPNGAVRKNRLGDAPPNAASLYGEPLVSVYDAERGADVYRTRKLAGKNEDVITQPAGVLKEQRDLENSHRKISELGTKVNDEWIGPGTAMYYNVKSKLPFTSLPEGYGDFISLQADLKNNIIKLITGAQMGQQEADRILKQVPTEDDKPEIWHSKYKQTVKNADFMLDLIHRQTGTDQNAPAPGAGKPKPGGGGSTSIPKGGAIEALLKGQ